MRIIVNDSSALIDLKKGGLLEIFLGLPFTLVVSDDLLADELLSFTKAEIALMRRKVSVATLDGDEMDRVRETQRASPALNASGWKLFDAYPAYQCAYKHCKQLVKVGRSQCKFKEEPLIAIQDPIMSQMGIQIHYTPEDWRRIKAGWRRLQKKMLNGKKCKKSFT